MTKCKDVLEAWYRNQIRLALPALLARWQPQLGASAKPVFVQCMKTKWGSSTPATGHIRLNTDLAKKPPDCLEYILVHELVHLVEPTHGERFVRLMDMHLPQWRQLKAALNRLPVRHEDWEYGVRPAQLIPMRPAPSPSQTNLSHQPCVQRWRPVARWDIGAQAPTTPPTDNHRRGVGLPMPLSLRLANSMTYRAASAASRLDFTPSPPRGNSQ